jgi:hypothetical protein
MPRHHFVDSFAPYGVAHSGRGCDGGMVAYVVCGAFGTYGMIA